MIVSLIGKIPKSHIGCLNPWSAAYISVGQLYLMPIGFKMKSKAWKIKGAVAEMKTPLSQEPAKYRSTRLSADQCAVLEFCSDAGFVFVISIVNNINSTLSTS